MSTPATIHREIAKLWTDRDFEGLRDLLHPEYSYTGGDGKEMTGGPDVGLAIARMFADAFPDGKLEIRNVYTDGAVAIAEMIGRGTHGGEFMGISPTGKPVEITICNVMEVRDGKAYREREYMDMLTLMAQLGVTKAPGKAADA
jgi:ketosteroid isomerase-like protein